MSEARRLAEKLADLERRLADLEGTPQLGNSSIEDGYLDVNDADGIPVLRMGEQDNGVYGLLPFNGGVVHANELEDAIVTEDKIADFAITVRKLKSQRHYLY